jgi:hypothetical protein
MTSAAAQAAEAVPGLNDVPLSQLLEVLVVDRELLAFDGRSGGQVRKELRLDEQVLWHGVRGEVGVVLTDQRILGVGVGSQAWRVVELQLGEAAPTEAMLGDRVVLAVTGRRAVGFGGNPLSLSSKHLGIDEVVLARRVGENVAVVVTNRRAIGLSPLRAGFSVVDLWIRETIESVNAAANLATVRSNRRVLIFRASTHSWETRRLDLPGGPNSEPPPASPSPSPPRFSPDSPPGPDNPHSSPSSGN